MTLGKNNRLIEARRQAVTKLWFKGFSYREIAKELEINPEYADLGQPSYVTVGRDLATTRQELKEKHEAEADSAKDISIAKLRLVQKQAWEDYDKSLGQHWHIRNRYLQTIKDCEMDIAKLQGTLLDLHKFEGDVPVSIVYKLTE